MKWINFLYFFISLKFYNSLKFIFFLSKKKSTDVFFYYPMYFGSKSSKIEILEPLISTLEQNNFTYKLIVEPNGFKKNIYPINTIPFDFMWFLVIVLRKFYRGNDYNQIDIKIGKVLSKIFCINHKVKNIITISQSFQSVFKGMFPNAKLYDYQHGLISNKYLGYINGDSVSEHILQNQTKVLLYGNGFKKKLLKVKGGEYFIDNSHVIGSSLKQSFKSKSSFNGNILYTLQFTNSHSSRLNKVLLSKTLELFNDINEKKIKLKIYLRSHPRFNECIDLSDLYKFDFVESSPEKLKDCFDICSLHLTEYSSVLFDSISEGIPTLLTRFSDEINVYRNEYDFPTSSSSLIDELLKVKNVNHYKKLINKQVYWSKDLYEPFNENRFLALFN